MKWKDEVEGIEDICFGGGDECGNSHQVKCVKKIRTFLVPTLSPLPATNLTNHNNEDSGFDIVISWICPGGILFPTISAFLSAGGRCIFSSMPLWLRFKLYSLWNARGWAFVQSNVYKLHQKVLSIERSGNLQRSRWDFSSCYLLPARIHERAVFYLYFHYCHVLSFGLCCSGSVCSCKTSSKCFHLIFSASNWF